MNALCLYGYKYEIQILLIILGRCPLYYVNLFCSLLAIDNVAFLALVTWLN